ncbi:hypothetical protein OY671_011522, partial [Metschnikowia pulcherrima]
LQLAQHRLRHPGPHRGLCPTGAAADLSPPRSGGARSARDSAHPAGHGARGPGQGRAGGGRHPRPGHHQPARDHRGSEPRHGPAPAPRHRSAGPPRRAAVRPAARGRPCRHHPGQDRPADRRLFLGHQAASDPGQRQRRAHRRRARRTGLRHRGQSADSAAH